MRRDLIRLIGDHKNLTMVIVLTYDVDLRFLQAMLLPVLGKCGHPNLTIYADANRAQQSFDLQHHWVEGVGKRYRLVPVAMKHGFSFHPKAVLLSSPTKATLFVGSGNMGFGGWRENGEVWMRFDTEEDGSAPFMAFQRDLRQIVSRVPLNGPLVREIEGVFDNADNVWASEPAEPDTLIGKFGHGESLLDAIISKIGERRILRMTILTPFFDEEGATILGLYEKCGSPQTTVYVQSGRTNLKEAVLKVLPASVHVKAVDFTREDGRRRFLHAKVYAFETRRKVVVAIGSANCSRAALTIPGASGNGELMAVNFMSSSDFRALLLDELELSKTPPKLQSTIEQVALDEQDNSGVRILAARQEGNNLKVAFQLSPGLSLSACLVDGHLMKYTIKDDQLSARAPQNSERLVLEASNNGTIVKSLTSWIDNEFELSSNAKRRTLANTIYQKVQNGGWNIGGWLSVLRDLNSDLQHVSTRQAGRREADGVPQGEEATLTYTESDVFSEDYSLPTGPRVRPFTGEDSRIMGLRQLLLNWFGLGSRPPSATGENVDLRSDDSSETDDEPVDQPEKFPSKATPQRASGVTAKDRVQAQNLVKKIAKRLTESAFLEERSPRQLGIDLGLAGTLLCLGLREKWLSREHHLTFTHQIWSALFFSSDPTKPHEGWIERLQKGYSSAQEFAQEMASADLSAVLAMWAWSVPRNDRSLESALFQLSHVSSVAKLPWLWNVNEADIVAEQLKKYMLCTKMMLAHDEGSWLHVRRWWGRTIQRGFALRKLNDCLDKYTLAEVGRMVPRVSINRGELLWQGHIGLCILTEDCNRNSAGSVRVLCLQKPATPREFISSYIVPVQDLVSGAVLPDDIFGVREQLIIAQFVLDISEGLSALARRSTAK